MEWAILRFMEGEASKEETAHEMAMLKDEGKQFCVFDLECGAWQDGVTLQQRDLAKTATPVGEILGVKVDVHAEQGHLFSLFRPKGLLLQPTDHLRACLQR
jgi:hypothetical protein